MSNEKHPTEKLGRKPSNKSRSDVLLSYYKDSLSWYKKLNKNAKLALVLAILLMFVALLTFVLTRTDGPKNQSDDYNNSESINDADKISATVTYIEGSLQKKDSESDWSDTKTEVELKDGDDIKTVGAASKATIRLPNGSEIRLDANTEISFELLNAKRVVVRQQSGHVYNRLAHSDEQNLVYVVKSKDAQYQAEGTAFETIASGDEQSVKVYESKIIETSSNKTIEAGEKLTMISIPTPSNNEKITKLNIEDVKKDLFIVWNRNLDLANDIFKSKLGYLSDFDAPEIKISSPSEGSVVLVEPNADGGAVEFRGTTERSTKLTVLAKSNSSSQPITITVADDGSFTSPLIESPIGDDVFEFVSKDKIGNTNTVVFKLTIQRKSQPAAAVSISLLADLSGNKVKTSWAISGTEESEKDTSIQLIYSKNNNPKLGEPESKSKEYGLSTNSAEIKTDGLNKGTTYYFSVCIYDKNQNICKAYSNIKSVVMPN